MARHNGIATFSGDGVYRYELGGDIGPEEPLFRTSSYLARMILWIMLNPSKANAQRDDRTLETIVRFSERWQYGQILVGNLSAFIATDPKDVAAAAKRGVDIVGPANDASLKRMINKVRASDGRIMVAWGAGADPERARRVHALAGEVYCLKTNKDGSPVHPLYQPGDLVPQLWTGMSA